MTCATEGCLGKPRKVTGICRTCYGKAYRAANKEKLVARQKEYHKEYYSKNKEKILEKNRKWYEANPEKRAELYKAWCLANPEKYKARTKKLREQNREYYREYSRNYGRKRWVRQATPEWVDRKALKEIYMNRPEGFHVDHIVPIRGENVCGLHVEWNLQYLPAEENLRKGNKFNA